MIWSRVFLQSFYFILTSVYPSQKCFFKYRLIIEVEIKAVLFNSQYFSSAAAVSYLQLFLTAFPPTYGSSWPLRKGLPVWIPRANTQFVHVGGIIARWRAGQCKPWGISFSINNTILLLIQHRMLQPSLCRILEPVRAPGICDCSCPRNALFSPALDCSLLPCTFVKIQGLKDKVIIICFGLRLHWLVRLVVREKRVPDEINTNLPFNPLKANCGV